MSAVPAKSFKIRLAQLSAAVILLLNSNELKLLFIGRRVNLAGLNFPCSTRLFFWVFVSSGGPA